MLEKSLGLNRWSGNVLKEQGPVPPPESDMSLAEAGKLVLPALPYKARNLGGALSRQTIDAHMHLHKRYVDRVRELVTGTDFETMPLIKVVRAAHKDDKNGELFRMAAQAWNHSLYWLSISPPGQDTSPKGDLLKAISSEFGSLDDFRRELIDTANKSFGSVWLWLVKEDDKPKIVVSKDAMTPAVVESMKPLFCIDLWEHAYYLDYYGDRRAYIDKAVLGLLNWRVADNNWPG
jgi:superoxide dismutase, Fe-Mn family